MSGGAFGSPAILERSGIGAKARLEKFGIETVVDLPGVGENYQGRILPCACTLCWTTHCFTTDHPVIFAPYLASEESDTIDGIVRNIESEFQSKSNRSYGAF